MSSYLFQKNFAVLIMRGVSLSKLVESNVFCYRFEYDQWPNRHDNPEVAQAPFNGSIFDIRYRYKEIFWQDQFWEISFA